MPHNTTVVLLLDSRFSCVRYRKYWRSSSSVIWSGDLPKYAASPLTARTYASCVAGEKPRNCKSSNIRWRKGVMVALLSVGMEWPTGEILLWGHLQRKREVW